MRNRSTIVLLAFILVGCGGPGAGEFESRWSQSPDRDWVGPEYWANRLQDWRVRNGRLESVSSLPMRTVHLLTRRLSSRSGDFDLSVRLGPMDSANDEAGPSSAGFLVGAGAGLDYRAASLIHYSHGPSAGLLAGIDTRGRLFFSDFELENGLLVRGEDSIALEDLDIENAKEYSEKLEYEIGEVIHHRSWNDYGKVLSKDVLPGNRRTIWVQFLRQGKVQLLEGVK